MNIIVPVRPQSFESFERWVEKIDNRAHIIEVWLDQIQDLGVFLKKLKTQNPTRVPLLGVCKMPEEKGNFQGTEDERIAILKAFLEAGGTFTDLDIRRNQASNIKKINPEKLFLSFHDFETVPEDLDAIFEEMKGFKPAVYKFAVTPTSKAELHRFLTFAQKTNSDNFIFTTMGKWGREGREKLESFSFAGFYALDSKSKTAQGQLCLDDL